MHQIAELKNVYFSYSGQTALHNINFVIKRGSFTGIIGPNGGGKTTIIRLIMGLITPDRGRVLLFGENPALSKNKNRMGYMPQRTADFNFDFPATVEEIVSLGALGIKKIPRRIEKSDKDKIYNAMETAGVMSFKNKLIGTLSGGELQRVFLAKMLVASPEILFLDEPTTALDYKTREKFMDLVINLNREKKTTVIFITHDNAQISKYADTLLVIDTKMLFCGSPGEFCKSKDMERYFGAFSQHIICHRHDKTAEKLWK